MSRLPVAVLGVLVAATVAAFFVTQHLKVTTPLLAGFPAPDPNVIDPLGGGKCLGVSHRMARVSFYLLHRSDDVDVYVIDQSGNVVDTLASARHMRRGVRHPDGEFSWDGRLSDGRVAPDGTYYVRVSLIHQGRSVVISNAAGPEPITVESTPPRPRVTSVSPATIPRARHDAVRIRISGDDTRGGYIDLYRSDLPGGLRLVKSFGLRFGARQAVWDGTIGGRPAPPGTYLVGLRMTDGACVTSRSPGRIRPGAAGSRSTAGAGVTVRYLAAAPPLDPAAPGSRAVVDVESAGGPYQWSLRRVGARKPAATGLAGHARLSVPVPAGRAGLYELTLRAGAYTTTVPIAARAPTPRRVLVVLPALSWQGLNPVDETGDGLPDTLVSGNAITLHRVFARAPAGLRDVAGLVGYLDSSRRSYDLSTDLGLIDGVGPTLRGHALVVLAGNERWLPQAMLLALRSYVEHGGHVLSLGIDSLRRRVSVRARRAYAPTAPARIDALDAVPGRVLSGALLVLRDDLGIFHGRLPAGDAFQSISASPLLSAAGTVAVRPAIIGYRLGRGTVVDIGLVGFGSDLARDRAAQGLVASIWKVLAA